MENGFHTYELAVGLVAHLRPVHAALRQRDRELADQLRRAATSVALNLAEGAGRQGRDRIHFYRIAAGSAREVRAVLDVARAWGEIAVAAETESLADRLAAMLWRLTRGPAS